jgi:hypothetical protein
LIRYKELFEAFADYIEQLQELVVLAEQLVTKTKKEIL